MEAVIEEVRELVAEAQRENPGIDAQVEILMAGPPLECPADHPLVEVARGAARALGLPDAPVGYEQASDGRFFADRGIPTILIGPGTAHLAHQPDEHIALADVYRAARLYALTAYRQLNPAE
jgi:acetylornithine deacetylase/succinyl-diaminopimelate desuccinylase-like protein